MDLLNTLQQKFRINPQDYIDTSQLKSLYNNKLNLSIIIYILIIILLRPYKAHELASKPFVQLIMICAIIYLYRINGLSAGLLMIAFLSSITLETNNDHDRNIPHVPIENRESFTGKGDSGDDIKQSDINDDDSKEDSEGDNEEDSDDDNEEDSDIDSKEDSEGDNEEDSEEDSDIDSNEDDEEDTRKGINEKFKIDKLFPKNSLNDTFKDLHLAIHKLENFVNSDIQ